MKIIQIVGYKNSGKTTLASHLIETFTTKGIRVASLKHHGHGGEPAGISNTDSEQHRTSGSFVSGVTGEHILQLANQGRWELSQILPFYQRLGAEVLVVEGFKNENYPKIVLLKNKNDQHLLKSLTNILAVMTWYPMDHPSLPTFLKGEEKKLCHWISETIFQNK